MLNKSPSVRTWIGVPESISRWLALSCLMTLGNWEERKKIKLKKTWSLSRPLCSVDINDDAVQRACLRFCPNYLKGPILVGTSYRLPLIWILDYIAIVPFRTIRNHSQATTISETSMIKRRTCLNPVREITHGEYQIYDIFVSTGFFLSGNYRRSPQRLLSRGKTKT